jgi:drug/metabolite transporter (DMT)-like permease
MILAVILLSGFVLAFIGMTTAHVDMSTVYIVFAGFSGPLLAAYFGYLLLKWKPKTER